MAMTARRCFNCGAPADPSWKFCPSCGEEARADFFPDLFSEFSKEIRNMTNLMDRNFEAFDATPLFSPTNAGGFSIRVTRRSNEKPRVEMRTYGNVRPEDVAKRIDAKMGVPASKALAGKPFQEPQTKMTKEADRVVVEMSLPKIASIKDVEISRLENSIEVRAYGREQGYFKIIAIPPAAQLIGRSFSGGVLRLELSR